MKNKFIILSFFFLTASFAVVSQEKLYQNSFSLSSIELLDGPFKQACDLNTEVLLAYDTDRLLAPFLKEAGLPKKAESFQNWINLDGHVGGHYLSALAIHYAATRDESVRLRMEYVISELKRCQDAHTNQGNAGYVGGVPHGLSTIWNRIKAGDPNAVGNGWVPWYNIHKTYAGLRDSWLYGGSELGKTMFLSLCDWGLTIIAPLSDEQMETMLNVEFGGMNEVYADAYQISGQIKYLVAAKRFSHKILHNSMYAQNDNLDNMHANTQVPKAVGYQRVAEVSNDFNYRLASDFFWKTVVENRSLSFGGNSRREHFPTAASCHEYVEEREGPESCNTNNMLKLTEGLFRMNPDAKYADYYERAMFNHILSTQHPEHGGYVYFTPARPRHYRVYSAVNKAMWCCVGTGMENHGKYGEFIYTHTSDSLYVNLFVASKLNWTEKGITVTQETNFPEEEGTTLKIELSAAKEFPLFVRYPGWLEAGKMAIEINGVAYPVNSLPSSYVEIKRVWNSGDIVTIKTPMRFTMEELPNVPNYVSIMRGPIVLGMRTGTEDLHGLIADEDRWAHIAAGTLLSTAEAPFIVGERAEVLQKLNSLEQPVDQQFTYDVTSLFRKGGDIELILEPFYKIHDSRYMMYWMIMGEREYEMIKEQLEEQEFKKMVLDQRTVDDVKPGEQQPEVDHNMKSVNSFSGYHNGESWRDARDGGYFSYNMLTGGRTDLFLMVRYWGNEGGARTFDILIDNQLLVTENVVGKWGVNEFVNVEYPIPATLLDGKESIVVTFQASGNNIAGGVFRVKILTPPPTKNLFKLNSFIVKCKELLDVSVQGTTDGTYPESSFTILQEKIDIADSVRNSEASTQEDVDIQVEHLKSAYQNFFASIIRDNEAVAHFRFKKDKTVVDLSKNNYSANLKNSAVTEAMDTFYIAKLGASNGYVDLGERIGDTIPHLKNFTISTYVFVDKSTFILGLGNYLWCFSTHDGATSTLGQYMAFRVNRQHFAISIGGTSNEVGSLDVGKAIDKGAWHHVLYTQYASVARLYLDGVLVKESPMYYNPKDIGATKFNWLGRPHIAGNSYLKNTSIYDFKIYNRTLTDLEINDLALVRNDLQTAYDKVTSSNPLQAYQKLYVIGDKQRIIIRNADFNDEVRVYSPEGKLLKSQKIKHAELSFSVKPGVYLVRVGDKSENVIVKK